MNTVFDFSKEYTRYTYVINRKTAKGWKRVKGLPVYETYEEADKAAKKAGLERYSVHREFAR